MNHAGIIDLVPAEVRAQWIRNGIYPNKSLFALFCEQARKNHFYCKPGFRKRGLRKTLEGFASTCL